MSDLISYPELLFKHPVLDNCKCGKAPEISTGAYANEPVMIVCVYCDESSDSFKMGVYEQGVTKAIIDWNNK